MLLEYRPDEVQLVISDNGIGFDPGSQEEGTAMPGPWGGFGLLGMRERLNALGGTLQIGDENGVRDRGESPPRGGCSGPGS